MLALDSGFAVAVKLCFICVERALQLADFTVQSKKIKQKFYRARGKNAYECRFILQEFLFNYELLTLLFVFDFVKFTHFSYSEGYRSKELIQCYLGYRYNNERASAGTLCDDCQELGVDGTEVVVMDILGDGDTVEAVLPVGYFSIDISKLGASVRRTP